MKIISKLSCFGLAILMLVGSTSSAWGHGAGGDIALFSTNGQADVGFAILDDDDDVQEFFDPNENVFLAVLLPLTQPNPIAPWEFASTEPGFDADEGTLPAEADISYNTLDLWYWDGADPSDVALVSVPDISAGVSPSPEKSFATGGFHSHPFFGVASGSGSPAEGVYVAEMSVSVEGLTDSDPYYMVTLVTDAVNSLPTFDEQTDLAEQIGEAVRSYNADPSGNPLTRRRLVKTTHSWPTR